ncbi:hypothetical protein DOTSEDRAFT_69352, partial [Dothistroma septosporum NZE10]
MQMSLGGGSLEVVQISEIYVCCLLDSALISVSPIPDAGICHCGLCKTMCKEMRVDVVQGQPCLIVGREYTLCPPGIASMGP